MFSWLYHAIFISLPVLIQASDYSSLFNSYYSPNYRHNHVGRNPCQPNPCEYDGQCIASGTSYDCSCPPGRKGERCEGITIIQLT